mmetsp:Transcript_117941/g.234957  ORF Transcript_117941/g.234957 Transcript_117941/m.234957 type:complete len:84 (-) Transcript_117941:30-281(-)
MILFIVQGTTIGKSRSNVCVWHWQILAVPCSPIAEPAVRERCSCCRHIGSAQHPLETPHENIIMHLQTTAAQGQETSPLKLHI